LTTGARHAQQKLLYAIYSQKASGFR